MGKIDSLNFLTEDQVRQLAEGDTPVFVYSRSAIAHAAEAALAFQAPYGLTVRYAMKANPHPEILEQLHQLGFGIDASSGFEADAALAAKIPGDQVSIVAQELPRNLKDLLGEGMKFTACSLHQLAEYGKLIPGGEVGVRLNPSLGDGYNNRLTTTGVATSFGIWHDYIPEIHKIADRYKLRIKLVHTHIGTGTNPDVWLAVAQLNLKLLEQFPDATTTSLGGGFKVARMRHEQTADLQAISKPIAESLEAFAKKTGRKIQLEIEPGTFLVANAGTLISKIVDIKDTGPNGYKFLIINGGMTEILRPAMYGAQHPLVVVPAHIDSKLETEDYAVSGHCCESSDTLTVVEHDPEYLEPRTLRKATIGDCLCVEGAGAYCASMRAVGYNSFPAAKEVLVD